MVTRSVVPVGMNIMALAVSPALPVSMDVQRRSEIIANLVSVRAILMSVILVLATPLPAPVSNA